MQSKSQPGEPNIIDVTIENGLSPAPDENRSEHTWSAWLTVVGSFLVYFVAFGYMNSFGFFQNYYAKHDLSESSPAIIALIGSLQPGLMYLVGPVTGAVFDAYGHRVCASHVLPPCVSGLHPI